MENNPQNIHICSIKSQSPVLPIPKVCCVFTIIVLKHEKTYGKPKVLGFSFCFLPLFQAEDSIERLNFIVPGSLLYFKDEIDKLFEKELNVLCRKPRFEKIFKKVQIKPVFTNRNNVKKLIVKTKLK